MTRVNTNVNSLTAQNRLNRTNIDLQTALTRLSTGLRINSGKDDPAGLIASESLRSDITSINKALTNTNRANQIIGTADSALGQVSSLLNDIRGLVTEAANKGALSDDEIAANQLQVDSSLEAINRIAQTTTFQGRRLLDGSLDFQIQQGTGYSTVKDLQIDSANLGAAGNVSVSVNISSAATRAKVTAAIPATSASAAASTTLTFNDGLAGLEASGTINFAESFAPGAEATTDVLLPNAYTAFVEANGKLTLAGGAEFTITAKNGSVVDGTAGNGVTVNVVTGGTSTTGAYDEASNTLTLTFATGTPATAATAVTALNAVTGINDKFTFSAGNATNIVAGDAGIRTGVLTGGTDAVATTRTQSSANAIEFNSSATNGFKFDIDAVAGGSFDGLRGSKTDFTFTIANTGGTSATFDAAANKVTIAIDRSQTAGAIETAINSGLSGQFVFSSGASQGTPADLSSAATLTDPLTTAGADTVVSGASRAGFKLTAKDGGLADGAKGSAAVLSFTAAASGTASTAVYDSVNNKLNVTVGKGATLDQIAAAINTEGNFVASDTKFGTYKFAIDTTGPGGSSDIGVSPTFSTVTDVIATSSFKLSAVDGGLADGTVGNNTKIVFATGANTSAAYDVASNELRLVIAANATIQNVADAISNSVGSVFSVSNIANGAAKFDIASTADLATRAAGTLSGGANNSAGAKDEIVVTADAAGAGANGVTVTFEEDASVTTGAPTATLVPASGSTPANILVRVNNAGNTSLASIASAINGITGYGATVSSTSTGDGLYKAPSEAPPTIAPLDGGITGGGLNGDLSFQLTGGSGSEVFKFQKGATRDNVIQSINLLKDSTGITATLNGNNIDFESVQYGSAGVVGIEVLSEGVGGTFGANLTGGPRAVGTDVVATINGTVATGKGNNVSLNTSTLSFNLTVADGSAAAVNFNITGGGALFQLGPDVVSNQQARLGISSLNTAKIGGVSGKLFELSSSGARSLTKDVTTASAIVDEVINKVTTLRGRLGAFQRTALDSNVVSLNDTLANLNDAQSSIRDADFAKESANLTRAQILVQSGTSVLGIANQSSQSVLSLLR
jgi:flagellin